MVLRTGVTATRIGGSPRADEVLIVGPSLGTSVEALWSRCATMLPFEVVGWDLPGHGYSVPTLEAFSVSDLADSVRDLGLSRACGRNAWYAGVSLGGAVGLELALAPGPFGAVAVVASAPKIGDSTAWRERADLVRGKSTAVMVTGSAQRWFAPGFTEAIPAVASALLTSLAETDRESYALACEALANFDIRGCLGDRQIPLLIAAGQHDPVVPPEQARAEVPGEFAVVPGCGHLSPAEDPAAVAGLLTRFFRSAGSAAATAAAQDAANAEER